MLYVTDDKIKEFNNCDIRIHKVELEKEIFHDGFVLTILAWAIPKVQWFEEETASGFITSGEDMGKPVGYRLLLPYEMIGKYEVDNNINILIDYILNSIPPFFEEHTHEIIDKFIECLGKFRRSKYI